MLRLLYTILFLLSTTAMAKPDSCRRLRKLQKACNQYQIDEVNVTCGRGYHRYWVDESVLYEGKQRDPEPVPGICVQVIEEIFRMSCDDLNDYKVPSMFCRNKKKKICRTLKLDGFGLTTYTKLKRVKKRRDPNKERKVLTGKLIEKRKKCSDIRKK